MNYYLTLTISYNKFTTQGSYDMELATTAQGSTLFIIDFYSNLSESITYTSTDRQINLDASIYDIDIDIMLLD